MNGIITAPSLLILANLDLSPNVLTTLQQQLYITETITGDVFDQRVANNSSYPTTVHNSGARLLVMRNLFDHTNRSLFDIVLFVKNGLVSVEQNRFGPPGITLSVDRVYLTALIKLQQPTPPPEEPADLDDGFIGQPDDDDFDVNSIEPMLSPEPPNQ